MHEKIRTTMVVWAALVASMFIYAGVVFVIDLSGEPADIEVMRTALAVAAMGSLTGVAFVRGQITQIDNKTLHIEDLARRAAKVEGRFQSWSIIGWALTESVVIYGLVLAFLSHDPTQLLPFLLVGLVAMALQMPREETLFTMYKAAGLPEPR